MIVYTLEQRWVILQHYFENHGNLAECVQKLLTDFARREAPSAPYVRYLVKKKWKQLASSSINQSVKNQKQCIHPKILLQWQKVCMKRHQHQFTFVFNNWTFGRHDWNEFYIKTLVWRHTKFDWFRSWSQLTIHCVFASGLRSTYRRCRFWQKTNHFFSWSSFWSWRVYKQAKLSH